MRVAVLDLGSTSFRLAVVDVDRAGRMVHRAKRRESLNLGLVVGRTGYVPEPKIFAAVSRVRRLRAVAERAGAERVVTVATSALRDASNREHLTAALARVSGRPIRSLSGEEEATLTYLAIRAGLETADRVHGLDLGGGSLELVVGSGERPGWVGSLPLGAGRMTGSFFRHDPPEPSERVRLERHVREQIASLVPDVRPGRWIAAGGTVKTLARILAGGETAVPIHGTAIARAALVGLSDRLARMKRPERRRLPGLAHHRVDVIAAGAVVLATFAEELSPAGLVVSEWGLREGIVLEAAGLTQTAILDADERRALAASR